MNGEPDEWRSDATSDLLDTILALPDRAAAGRFFRDLCTLRELHDLAQRWQVVRELEAVAPTARSPADRAPARRRSRASPSGCNHGTGGYREALERPADGGDRGSIAPSQTVVVVAPLEAIASPGDCAWPSPTRAACQEPTLELLRDAGLRFEDGTRALAARVEDFPLDILFVRTDDIAEFVADGVADLGITGTNLLVESGAELDTSSSWATAAAGSRWRCPTTASDASRSRTSRARVWRRATRGPPRTSLTRLASMLTS